MGSVDRGDGPQGRVMRIYRSQESTHHVARAKSFHVAISDRRPVERSRGAAGRHARASTDATAPRTNGERFIHGEIYRVRPDVGAIVHSHSPAVIPFSISPDRPLRPVLHMAGFLPARVPVFDHRDLSKVDPSLRGKLMVNNAKLGAGLAKILGNDSVVLIRGHGNAVVGASLPWAVLRAVYTQLNARVQMDAIALGGQVIHLDEDELKMHPVEVFDVDRPWQNLKSRLPKNP